MNPTLRTILLMTVGCAVTACGCSRRNGVRFEGLNSSLKEGLGISEPPLPPIHRIVPLWKAARGQDLTGMPSRGAAGQIMFFTVGSETPVKLRGDGMVTIYVFDDQGPPEEAGKPLHKYRFSVKAWNMYLQKDGTLGPSYHVFIPYTRKVVNHAKMTLAVRLQSKEGRLLAMSELPTITLPGPIAKDAEKGRNLASPQPTGETKTTTLNQRFFNLGQDRALRRRALQQGTQVSYQTQADHPQPTSRPRRRPQPTFGNASQKDRIRQILNELGRQSRSPSPQRRNPLSEEATDGDDAPPLRRGFRLSSASRRVPVERFRSPAFKRDPAFDKSRASERDPFAQNVRRWSADDGPYGRAGQQNVVTADARRNDAAAEAQDARTERRRRHPLIDERAAWHAD